MNYKLYNCSSIHQTTIKRVDVQNFEKLKVHVELCLYYEQFALFLKLFGSNIEQSFYLQLWAHQKFVIILRFQKELEILKQL